MMNKNKIKQKNFISIAFLKSHLRVFYINKCPIYGTLVVILLSTVLLMLMPLNIEAAIIDDSSDFIVDYSITDKENKEDETGDDNRTDEDNNTTDDDMLVDKDDLEDEDATLDDEMPGDDDEILPDDEIMEEDEENSEEITDDKSYGPTVKVHDIVTGDIYKDSVSFCLYADDDFGDYYVRYRCIMLTSEGQKVAVEDSTVQYNGQYERNVFYSEEGIYDIVFYAYNSYGDASEKINRTFIIDRQSPDIFFEGGDFTKAVRQGTDLTIGVRELFYEGMTVQVRIFRKEGDLLSEIPVGAFEYKAVTNKNSYTFAGDGVYYVTVVARDRCGHETTKDLNVIVDAKAPEIDILFNGECPENGQIIADIPRLTVSVTEPYYSGGIVEISLFRKLGTDIFENLSLSPFQMTGEKSICPIDLNKEGEYELSVRAVDGNGNENKENISFIIDTVAPKIGYIESFNERFLKSFEIPENMSPYIEDMTGVNYKTYLNSDETSSGEIKKDGKYILQIVAWDEAGNSSEEMIAFIVDNTSPTVVLSGLNENGNLEKDMPVTISLKEQKDYLTNVYVNGENIKLSYDKKTAELIPTEYGSYRIYVSARDNAGNCTSETISTDCNPVLASPLSAEPQNITIKTLEKKENLTHSKMPSAPVLWALCGGVCGFAVLLVIIAFSYEISYTR